MKTKLLLVDDHAIIFDGMRMILSEYEDVVVHDVATSTDEALSIIEKQNLDVAIVDISLGDENGVQLIECIHENWPNCGIIVFSMHSDASIIRQALSAGALGYIHKSATKDEIYRAIKEVANGRTYLCNMIREIVVRDYAGGGSAGTTGIGPHLSNREIEVTRCLALGLITKEIAEKLHISKNTVDTHRAHIMEKLKTRSLADVTRFAIREGIVKENEI